MLSCNLEENKLSIYLFTVNLVCSLVSGYIVVFEIEYFQIMQRPLMFTFANGNIFYYGNTSNARMLVLTQHHGVT